MIEGISMYNKLFKNKLGSPFNYPEGILKMKDPDDKRSPELILMTFKQFINHFSEDIKELLDVDEEFKLFTSHNNHEILLLVDMTD